MMSAPKHNTCRSRIEACTTIEFYITLQVITCIDSRILNQINTTWLIVGITIRKGSWHHARATGITNWLITTDDHGMAMNALIGHTCCCIVASRECLGRGNEGRAS